MLDRLFTKPEERMTYPGQATNWGDWPGEGIYAGGPSMGVNARSSLQLLAVYGCVRLITDAISTLEVQTFRLVNGLKVRFTPPTWLTQPTVDLDFPAWCSQLLSSLLLQGNAYVNVLRGQTGQIVELVPLDPLKVQVRRDGGRKVFVINGAVFNGEILHIVGLMLPGSDVGLSPVDCARQAIGLGLASQTYGANYFEKDGNMPGVIEMPKKAVPGALKDIAEVWQRKRSKANRGLPGVLDDGATWKPTGVTNEAAQFLQTRNYTAAEIAGQMFLVDPSDLGIAVNGTSLTYGNLEQRNQRRVQVTLLPWIIRIEQAVSMLLRNPQHMKFNVDSLLRGDLAARSMFYKIASEVNVASAAIGQPPFLLTSEMRHDEDRDPLTADQVPVLPAPVAEPAPHVMTTSKDPLPPTINVEVHIPESRQDAPVVNVTMPEQAAPVTNITMPEQAAPQVHVRNDAPVINLPEVRGTSKRIEHDADGRIVRVVEELV